MMNCDFTCLNVTFPPDMTVLPDAYFIGCVNLKSVTAGDSKAACPYKRPVHIEDIYFILGMHY